MIKFRDIAVGGLFVLLGQKGFGQIQNPPPAMETPIYIEGFNYPKFDELSYYAWFKVHMPISQGHKISLGGDHYRRPNADRFQVGLQWERILDKRTYILGGYQQEWDLYNGGRGYPNPKPNQDVFLGVGRELGPGMLLEAKLIQPLGGNPEFHKIGLEGVGRHFSLGTKVKL